MNAERLLEHYDRIADAPDAIDRLRRFILDLAVRGKLVPQNTEDEPAETLLNQIAIARDSLTREARTRSPRSPDPATSEAEFEIPATWDWSRLSDLTSYIQRGKSPKYVTEGGLPVVSQKCVQWSGLDLSVARQIDPGTLGSYEEVRLLRDGDLLWNSTGTGTIGRIIRLVDPPENLVCDSHVTVVRCLMVNPEYIRIWLCSDYVYGRIEERAAGSTNQVELTARMANDQVVPVPPISEQGRIVSKVNELMALCDELESAGAKVEATRNRLTTSTLSRLSEPNPETFESDVRFALDVLPEITLRPEQIIQVRNAIVDLAVRGQLETGDPGDEPASELLNRIHTEKARITRAKRLSPTPRLEPLPLVSNPKWETVTLESVLLSLQTGPFGSSLHKSDYVVGGVPVINPASIQNGSIVPIEKMSVGQDTLQRLSTFQLCEGDIVLARRGEMGRCAVVTARESGWLCGTGSLILRLPKELNPWFLALVIGSPRARTYLGGSAVGSTMQNLNQRILLNMRVPLPPGAEQQRIIARVDELISLCDRLEASLVEGAETRRRLLNALPAEALEPAVTPADEVEQEAMAVF